MSISLDEMTSRTDGQATKYTLNLDLKMNFVCIECTSEALTDKEVNSCVVSCVYTEFLVRLSPLITKEDLSMKNEDCCDLVFGSVCVLLLKCLSPLPNSSHSQK